MQTLSFTPGRAFLSSDSSAVPWTVVFEDEGIAGYFYACDRSRETQEEGILDAMLIYNVSSLQDREVQRLVAVEWTPDGERAALYLDGTAQALYDFRMHQGYCRLNFPNFLESRGDIWRRNSHAWSEEAVQQFESVLYG